MTVLLFSILKQDVDEFFENEKSFLVEYNNKIKDATLKSDRMTKCHGGEHFIDWIVWAVINDFLCFSFMSCNWSDGIVRDGKYARRAFAAQQCHWKCHQKCSSLLVLVF